MASSMSEQPETLKTAQTAQLQQPFQGAVRDDARKKGQPPADGMVSTLLIADHRAVKKLFDQYEAGDEAQRGDIIARASQALIIHTILEEEIFYHACRGHFSSGDVLDEAQVEHDNIKILIADLLHGSASDPYRDAKFRVLAEQVRHHVCEEEQAGGIFHKARACGIDTPDLAARITARRRQLEEAEAVDVSPSLSSLGCYARQAPRRTETRKIRRGQGERGHLTSAKEKGMTYSRHPRDPGHNGHIADHHGKDRPSTRRGNDRPRDGEGRFAKESHAAVAEESDDLEGGRPERPKRSLR